MEYIAVIVAGMAAFAFGAVWYSILAKQWMAATGVTEEQQKAAGPAPYIIGIVSAILCAGMMRHVLAGSGIETPMKGLVSGLGMGLFIAAPWLATTYAFGQRSKNLILIDGGYATFGCAIIGLVLSFF